MIILNGKEIEFKKYPNGEFVLLDVISQSDLKTINKIIFRFEDNDDITKLILIKGWIDDLNPFLRNELYIPYLPYSRADRSEDGSCFSLSHISEIINLLSFDRVYTGMNHSKVSAELIYNIVEIDIINMLTSLLIEKENTKDVMLMATDNGTIKRYGEKASIFDIVCNKKRDFKTGKLIEMEVVKKPLITKGRDVVIIDDLCSKGGTFNLAIDKALELGARNIYLVVENLEKTVLKGSLLENKALNGIYATDSMGFYNSLGKIKIYKWEEMMKLCLNYQQV